jgi:phosphoserine phosphatase
MAMIKLEIIYVFYNILTKGSVYFMKKAFCFDLDGTLTKKEMLSELSKELGIYDEMNLLTEATVKGVLPFEASFKLRIKLLSSIPVSKVKSILNQVPLSINLINFIKNNKQDCFVVTGNLDVYIEDLIKNIGCNVISSIAEVEGDYVKKISHILNKAEAIHSLKDRGYTHIISVGDGSNDIPMFENSLFSIAYFGINKFNKNLSHISSFVTFNEDSLCKILKML